MSAKEGGNMAKPISCTIKPAQLIRLGDIRTEFHSGCSIVEVTFPNVVYVAINEIHLKNYYTAWLSVHIQSRTHPDKGDLTWRTCVRRFTMMPHPHNDEGSDDYFTITRKHMECDVQNISSLRLILRQPSPLWKDFRIDDLRMFKASMLTSPEVALPKWVMEHREQPKRRELQGLSVDKLSQDLQELWALTEQAASAQPTTQVGRFDVDGSYDINLLSYT